MRAIRSWAIAAAAAVAACAGPSRPPAPTVSEPAVRTNTDVADLKTEGQPQEFFCPLLDATLILPAGVFPPHEANGYVLPFMADHPELFAGKRVYEIGTGSGVISLAAAKLGARKVVCTDIAPEAIASVRRNAERLGFAAVIDARLVGPDDMAAFAVVRSDEVFDTIISNPPYALDLDADTNTALVDRGDLGFSLVRGLQRHLAPDGIAALFYYTLFYHEVMVKFARWSGYEVRSHTAMGLSPWGMEALFNLYLRRLLQREGLPPDAFRFYKEELPYAVVVDNKPAVDLVGDAPAPGKSYRGFLTIRHRR